MAGTAEGLWVDQRVGGGGAGTGVEGGPGLGLLLGRGHASCLAGGVRVVGRPPSSLGHAPSSGVARLEI